MMTHVDVMKAQRERKREKERVRNGKLMNVIYIIRVFT